MQFPLPRLLTELLANGVWPADLDARRAAQKLRPIVSPDRVRLFAAEETQIYLHSPPFRTVEDELALPGWRDYWINYGALHQLVPAKALVIGEFEIGSDACIILDYARNEQQPPVYRLRWNPDRSTEWVLGAASFEDFVDILQLRGGAS